MQINKLETFSLIFNALMGGLGTGAGFAFPSLAFLAALFGLTGSALIFISIVGIVVFGIIALSSIYFFCRTFSNTRNFVNKIEEKQDALLNALIQYAALTKNENISNEKNSILQKIYPMLDNDEYANNLEKIKTTLKKEFPSIEAFTSTLASTVKLPEDDYNPISSPGLYTSVNLFITYGCILGPCSGLIGAITGIGIIGGISAIAPPILAAIILTTIALTVLAACFTYYSENRNVKRSSIITQMEYQTDHFERATKNILFSSHFERTKFPLSAEFTKLFSNEPQNQEAVDSPKTTRKFTPTTSSCIII